jgi:hypothetical protein
MASKAFKIPLNTRLWKHITAPGSIIPNIAAPIIDGVGKHLRFSNVQKFTLYLRMPSSPNYEKNSSISNPKLKVEYHANDARYIILVFLNLENFLTMLCQDCSFTIRS